MSSSFLQEIVLSRPVWWIYQGLLMVADVAVISSMQMGPLSWCSFISVTVYNLVDATCIKNAGLRINRKCSNAFNVTIALLLIAHARFYKNEYYYIIGSLHLLPIIGHIYDRLAHRTQYLPTVGGFINRFSNYYSNSYTSVNSNSDENCTICLCSLSRGAVALSCLHVFHRWCISEWKAINAQCPLCRQVII